MKTEVTVLKPMILAGTVYQAGDKIDVVKDQTWEETWFTPKGIIDAIAQGYIEKVADGEYKVLPGKVITYSAYTYKEGETFHAPDIYDEAWTPVKDKPWIKALVAQGVVSVSDMEPEPEPEPEPVVPTSIKMSPATKTAYPGDVFTITATVLPEGAEGTPVFTLDGAGVSVDASGEVTVLEDAEPGTCTVTALLGDISGTTKITIKERS